MFDELFDSNYIDILDKKMYDYIVIFSYHFLLRLRWQFMVPDTNVYGPVRPESKAGQMAIKIFGEGVELLYGKGSNYPSNVSNAHAEARGIQAY